VALPSALELEHADVETIQLHRSLSNVYINEGEEPGLLSPGPRNNTDSQVTKEDLVARVEHLVDTEYDILKADALFEKLETLLGSSGQEWAEMLQSRLFGRFQRKLDIFLSVGSACCATGGDWFCAYRDAAGLQSIHGYFDPHERNVLHYRVRVQIPAGLPNIFAFANEVQLMPTWNALVVNQPEVIGRRTAHYMVLNYQMSLLGGAYKLDFLNEIRRFSDPSAGFLAECIRSVTADHPAYRKPAPGYRRPETQVNTCWVACGEHSVLIQAGTVKLPFAFSKWLASTVGSIAGKFIIGGLVKNSLRATEPGNPWEKLLAEDSSGLYKRLAECGESPNSLSRRPSPASKDARVGDFDLWPFFERRRVKHTCR